MFWNTHKINKRNFELNAELTKDIRNWLTREGWVTEVPVGYQDRFNSGAAYLIKSSSAKGMGYLRRGTTLNLALKDYPDRIFGWEAVIHPEDAASNGLAVNFEKLLHHLFLARLFNLKVLYVYRINYAYPTISGDVHTEVHEGGFWLSRGGMPDIVRLWLPADVHKDSAYWRRVGALVPDWLRDIPSNRLPTIKEPFVVITPNLNRASSWQDLVNEFRTEEE